MLELFSTLRAREDAPSSEDESFSFY